MKKWLFISFIVSISLTGCGKTGCNHEYFRSVSSISLPDGTSIIDCFDNLEWAAEAVFQLPDTLLEEFIRENEFQAVEKNNEENGNSFFLLPEKNRPIYDNGELLSVAGSNDGRTNWHYILNKKTGKLWVHINYPDWGGT